MRGVGRMAMDPDRLAGLEEQRRFLLRSLADLEREHDAGDVDEVDYRELKDGYTVRAAETLRAIEAGRSALPDLPPTDWIRRLLGIGLVVVLIGVVWWALAASSATRLQGQQITGLDPRDERQVLLSQARSLQASDPAGAASLYALVLEDDPTNAEALTYRGWTLALAVRMGADVGDPQAQLIEAVDSLLSATEVDPTYADPQCFLGVVYGSFVGQAELALPRLDACLAAGPPADVRGLVEALRDDVRSEVDDDDAATTTTTDTTTVSSTP